MKEGREGFDFLTDSVEEEEIWRRNERECGGKGGSIEERVHFWGTRRAVSNNLTPFSLRIATWSRLGLPAIKRASRLRLPNIVCLARFSKSRDKNREEEGRKEWKRRTNGKNDDRMRNEAVRETCQRVKKNPLSEKETVGLSARNCARR